MEILNDLGKILGRIVTILPLMLFATLFMGRRSVGELPVFDFLVILSLGAVVGADIADPKINHIHTAFAIVAIALLQRFYSELSIRNTKFRKWTSFDPVVVVKDGKFMVNSLKRIKYSVDNVLELLREVGVFNMEEVHLAVIEANGRLSVYKKPEKAPVTPLDLGIAKIKSDVAFPVIVEGKVYKRVLRQLNLNEEWLDEQLKNINIEKIEDVFFASVNEKKQLHVSMMNDQSNDTANAPLYF